MLHVARLELQDGNITALPVPLPVPLPTTRRPVGISTGVNDLMSPATAKRIACLRDAAAEVMAVGS